MNRSTIFTAAHKSAREIYANVSKFNSAFTYRQAFAIALKEAYKSSKKANKVVEIELGVYSSAVNATYKQVAYLRSLTSLPFNNTQAMKKLSLASASEAIEAIKAGNSIVFV